VSKATCRLAIHKITESHTDIHYFPAYELMLDDLRDYRFYDVDMVHPNQQAIDYIWKKFIDATMDQDSLSFIKKWEKVLRALAHKPRFPESAGYQHFLQETIRFLEELREDINIEPELSYFTSKLSV